MKDRNQKQQMMKFKIIGARKENQGKELDTYGQTIKVEDFLNDMKQKKVLFFGELQFDPSSIKMEEVLARTMLEPAADGTKTDRLNIVMEHFSFEMQDILDDYQSGKIDIKQLD